MHLLSQKGEGRGRGKRLPASILFPPLFGKEGGENHSLAVLISCSHVDITPLLNSCHHHHQPPWLNH